MLANYVAMKKNTLTKIVASLLVGCGTVYSEPIHATLEVMTNQAGWFVMHIRNISTNSIRFLDIQEGTGLCGNFYEVTVEKDSKSYTSQGNCYYALNLLIRHSSKSLLARHTTGRYSLGRIFTRRRKRLRRR